MFILRYGTKDGAGDGERRRGGPAAVARPRRQREAERARRLRRHI